MAGPTFGWNAAAGRYVDSRGKFVTEGDVRHALDVALRYHATQARTLAIQLREQAISTSEFSTSMRLLIRDTQLYSAALASGGRAQMTPQLLGLAGQQIAVQNSYLANFMQEIRLGAQPMDGRLLARAELYALNAWGTWSTFQQRLQLQLGHTECRNVLQPADHCTQCVALWRLGWMPISEMVPVGQRICLVRCRCYLLYR